MLFARGAENHVEFVLGIGKFRDGFMLNKVGGGIKTNGYQRKLSFAEESAVKGDHH